VGQLEGRVKGAEEKANKTASSAHSASAELEEMRTAAELRAANAEGKLRDLTDRVKAAETRAAQQEARAAQAEARAKEHAAKAGASSAAESKARVAEQRVADLEGRVKVMKAAEDEVAHMQAQEIRLKARIAELEAGADSADITKPGGATAESAELERLRSENSSLKKKLMSAETAVEAAASLKARVAKLEAQLKATKK
jgi:DNA repair exonuclease SbcCD ATPase subunit